MKKKKVKPIKSNAPAKPVATVRDKDEPVSFDDLMRGIVNVRVEK